VGINLGWLFSHSTPAPLPAPAQMSPAPRPPALAHLQAALAAAAPQADPAIWLAPLTDALISARIDTAHRIAAFLGQVAVEAGPGFQELAENLRYTHAERICAVFPTAFPDVAAALPCVGNPEALADAAYAGRLGNGDASTGDGWRFRGRGLIQITGRSNYTALAATLRMTPEQAADYCERPAGAAASAAWFWATRNLNPLADAWTLAAITLRVNGTAMEGHAARVAASTAALDALIPPDGA
jgi:putative chitinase